MEKFFGLVLALAATRDVDPETDGLYVQGSVTARAKLRHALRDKIEAVNPLARRNRVGELTPNMKKGYYSTIQQQRGDPLR